MRGYFRVLRADPKGLLRWAEELHGRGIPANFNIGNKALGGPSLLLDAFTHICSLGFEFGGSYDDGPFWEMPYDAQYEAVSRLKDGVEGLTGGPMRLLSSKYSAYNEDTLKIAEKLGIAYLFGRGTAGMRAQAYKPEEYAVKIISTSDVVFRGMSGTLADGALWSRGAVPEEFRELLFSLNEDRITLVAQSQLSGVKLRWRQCYIDFLNAKLVQWQDVDSFAADYVMLPAAEIPVNRSVEYAEARPAVPLDAEPDID